MNDLQKIAYVLLASLLVVALSFGRLAAQQQLSTTADSLTDGVGGKRDVSKHFQSVVVDSISPKVTDQLVKAMNPVVTPSSTRLALAPTARALKSGTGYVESMALFLWSVGYGLNDKHAILGGMSLLPGWSTAEQVYYFATKSSIYSSV